MEEELVQLAASNTATAGTANTGGGGGGGWYAPNRNGGSGAAGGKGVIIIRMYQQQIIHWYNNWISNSYQTSGSQIQVLQFNGIRELYGIMATFRKNRIKQ